MLYDMYCVINYNNTIVAVAYGCCWLVLCLEVACCDVDVITDNFAYSLYFMYFSSLLW